MNILKNNSTVDKTDSVYSSIISTSSDNTLVSSEITLVNDDGLDPRFSKLLLVNADNPLPDNYDYEGNLITIDHIYINGSNDKVDKDILPYLLQMINDAKQSDVELYVRSPYRTLNDQTILFNNQVNKWLNQGLESAAAESKAATVVARPKTSEHHTGLAIDFNIADDSFLNSKGYLWLTEHAAEYGFIMRYPEDKQDITGVIYEPWHWRFVGINEAEKINNENLCLEEYLAKTVSERGVVN